MSRRFKLAALVVFSAVIASILFGVLRGGHSAARQTPAQSARMLLKNATAPGRIEKYLSQNKSVFNSGREAAQEASGGPAQEDYDNRAFPATRIAAAQVQAAQAAALRVASRAPHSSTTRWDPVGPFTLNVSRYGTQTYGPPTQWSGRETALAVGKPCNGTQCVLYMAAAGGGVWRTKDIFASPPVWEQISDGQIGTNAIGSITVDPTDPTGKTIYAGTGEPNGSSDSEDGIGLFKSTDSGQTWSLLGNSDAVAGGRGIAAISVDPTNPAHLLMGTAVARHGLSSNSGGRFTPPGAPVIGLYESVNGGATWTLNFSQPQDTPDPTTANGNDFFRGGVTKIEFDPNNPSTYYFSMFGYGLFRHSTAGGTENIFFDDESPTDALSIRAEFDAVDIGATTRIYLGMGWNEDPSSHGASRLYRVNDASQPAGDLTTGGSNGGWTDLSSDTPSDPGFGSFDFCEAQCSYDMFVASPPGRPNTVVLGGSMQYGELPLYGGADISNGRAVVMSTDSGVHFTDMTGDATPRAGGLLFQYEDMHPDQHAAAFVPTKPDVMIFGSDGGIIRTDGSYKDNSHDCGSAIRNLSPANKAICQQFLKKIPNKLITMNAGLNTLQFQSLSVDSQKPMNNVLGGTQDNGTLAFSGNPNNWFLGITGDGGDSGIDVANRSVIFHTYTDTLTDTNFRGALSPETWVWTADPMFPCFYSATPCELDGFYSPMLQDPKVGGTIYAGQQHVWRTFDNGGNQSFLEAHCNTTGVFGTSDLLFTGACGDWQQLGRDPLTASNTAYGTDKSGHYIVALARAMTNNNVLYAGTRRGRIFVSLNARQPKARNADFYRIDGPLQPTRFPSSISVDPTNAYHLVVTYSSYNAYAVAAGTAIGHVFDVVVNPASCTTNPHKCAATWTNIDNNLGDEPVLDSVIDGPTGDVYISTDFGVNILPFGASTWESVGNGLPKVAVYGLNLATKSGGQRVLYGATHGRGAWRIDVGTP